MNRKVTALAGILAFGLLAVSAMGFAEDKPAAASFWDKTKVTGGIDVNYNYNFNRPTTTPAAAATNQYRVFDQHANNFNVSLVELAIENAPADWITFRTDLDFGKDAAIVAGAEGWGGGVLDLQQAYVALKAPIGSGMTFKIGKFVTLHGNEVIESWANNNSSRSFLFNYAIPLTHTGVMMNYSFADWIALDLGVVNGWNLVTDNNNGKSIHAQFTIKPVDKVTWLIGGTFGPEATGKDGNQRLLVDTTLSYAPTAQWSFAINYDLGRDSSFLGHAGIADWQGFAAYAHWKPFDMFGLSLRGEYFRDDVGISGVPGGSINNVTGVPSGKLYEGTLTSHCYLADGLDLRFEFRHDQGDQASFTKGNGTFKKFQDTIGSQLVYSF